MKVGVVLVGISKSSAGGGLEAIALAGSSLIAEPARRKPWKAGVS